MTATEVHRASPPTEQLPSWYARSGEQVCAELGVDPAAGLDAAEVERRRTQYGANKLAAAEKEPGWHAFLRQYQDLMQIVLVGAAVVSVVALDEWHTAIVVFAVTLLNAILGLNQEGKAAESVAALQKMLVLKAHVRRGGVVSDIPAEELVPGDVVTFEAGDKVPADGRLLIAATLEIEESALTGESTPAPKSVAAGGGRRGWAQRQGGYRVHELDRDARTGRDGRHSHRHGDRGRADLGDASGGAAGEDAADPPA